VSSSRKDTVSIDTNDNAYHGLYFFFILNILKIYEAQRGSHVHCHDQLPVANFKGIANILHFYRTTLETTLLLFDTNLLKLSFASSAGNPNCKKSLGRLCELHAWIARENNPIKMLSCSAEKKQHGKHKTSTVRVLEESIRRSWIRDVLNRDRNSWDQLIVA